MCSQRLTIKLRRSIPLSTIHCDEVGSSQWKVVANVMNFPSLQTESALRMEGARGLLAVFSGPKKWPKFIPVDDHPALVTIVPHAACHHLDWHPDLHS